MRRSFVRPFARAAQLLLSSRTTTERPDAAAWALAPALLAGLAAVAMAIVPLAPSLMVSAPQAGIVLFGAVMALVMVAIFLHGWSANATFPLIGAYRFVAQALSYEMPLALVLIAAAIPAQSLAIADIVNAQARWWNVLREPLGLPLYLIASLGIAFWGPLALPDALDLAGGTASESSGVALLLWRGARAATLFALSAMGAAVFLGGWYGPWLPGAVWMLAKTAVLLIVLLLAGHLLGRARLERFVLFGWVVLIPLALVDVFAAGVLAL